MLSRANRKNAYGARTRRGVVAAALAALAAVAAGAIVACSESPVAPGTAMEEAGTEPARTNLGPLGVRTVGAYHNEYLDFVFPELLKAVTAGADQRKICRVIAKGMREFVVARAIRVNPASIGDDVAGGRCADAHARGLKPGARYSLTGNGVPIPELDAIIAEMSYAVESGRSIGELATLFDEKVAYARANFPEAEAEVVAAAASVGLSSAEYWDANYETQKQALLDTKTEEAYNRGEVDAPKISMSRSASDQALIGPPEHRLQGLFWSNARKVGVSDLAGAVKGGIKGWSGGLQGIAVGALVEGGAASAGSLIAIALQ